MQEVSPSSQQLKVKRPADRHKHRFQRKSYREGGCFHSHHLRSLKPTAWQSLIEQTQFTAQICHEKFSCHYVITGRNRRTLSQKSQPVAKEIAVPSSQIIWNPAFERQRIEEVETLFWVKKINAGEAGQIQISYAVTCGLSYWKLTLF